MKKHLLSLFVVLLPLLASAQLVYDYVEIGDIEYVLYEGHNTAEVSEWEGSLSYSGSINIPATIAYDGTVYLVTKIGYGAFSGCSKVTSITIPESVTMIEGEAFERCI